jgi:hypothetical protein
MLRFFRQEVPLALTVEMRTRRDDYAALERTLAPVLGDEAAQREAQWRAYRAKLVQQVRGDHPLFRLDPNKLPPVSLADIYVPLRAWVTVREMSEYTKQGYGDDETLPKKCVGWLKEMIWEWLNRRDYRDGVRVIGGEPGAGKSSFTKIFAAELAHENRRVLLLPLGRLNYHTDALQAVTAYLSHKDELGHDPFVAEWLDSSEPLLLILDGLDELAKAGQGAEEIVAGFVNSLIGHISVLNHGTARIFILLAGRPGAAGATRTLVHTDHARLEVLRYVYDADGPEWIVSSPELKADQRGEWWRSYGRFSKTAWTGLPDALKSGGRRLDDLTAQPLLNYLLAQIIVLEGEEAAARIDGLHALYARLFTYVLERKHRAAEASALPEAADALEESDRMRVLEEVAVAAWQSGDRTVARETLKEHFKKQGLLPVFDRAFKGPEGFEKGIGAVLDSFFCAPREGGSQRAFEFTHKSFREFLTARRIVREVRDLTKRLGSDPMPQDIDDALRRWIALCAPAKAEHDLADLIREEIRSHSTDDVRRWMEALRTLLSTCIHQGPPIPLGEEMRARGAEQWVRCAEIMLLTALNSCARTLSQGDSRTMLVMDWSKDEMRNTIHRLIGPYYIPYSDRKRPPLALECLSYFNFTKCDLSILVLAMGNFEKSFLLAQIFVWPIFSWPIFTRPTLGTQTLGARTFGARTFGARTLGARTFGARTLRARTLGARTFGTRTLGARTFGTRTLGARTFGARTFGARTLRARTLGARTLRARTLGTRTFGARTFGARTFGARTLRARTLGTRTFGARTFGARTFGARTLRARTLGTRTFGTRTFGTRTFGARTLRAP